MTARTWGGIKTRYLKVTIFFQFKISFREKCLPILIRNQYKQWRDAYDRWYSYKENVAILTMIKLEYWQENQFSRLRVLTTLVKPFTAEAATSGIVFLGLATAVWSSGGPWWQRLCWLTGLGSVRPAGLRVLSGFSRVWLLAAPWTVAHQAPRSMEFSSPEYWSGWPCPPPGDLPNPGIEPASPAFPALQVDSLLLSHQGN